MLNVISESSVVAVFYRFTADHGGVPISLEGAMHLEVSGGLIGSRVDYWDGLTFLSQTSVNN